MPKVIYSNTKDADMFYAMGMRIPDPFFFIDLGEKKYVFLDVREYAVFEEKNRSDIEAVRLEPILKEVKAKKGVEGLRNELALHLFENYGLLDKEVEVPASFPLDMADFLRKCGATLVPKRTVYPERMRKTTREVEAIRGALRNTYPALARIEDILRESTIQGDTLRYRSEILTSELLKKEAAHVLVDQGVVGVGGMIISSGVQAAIPHHPGEGPIRPHALIICDLFPRDGETGYFADITRTYVKGNPSVEIRSMYDAVLEAQEKAFEKLRPGVPAGDVHEAVCESFQKRGYDIGGKGLAPFEIRSEGAAVGSGDLSRTGFIHSTGHGLGLEIHEAPPLGSANDTVLASGNVVTIEPGLYYPEIGGVRIEDVVHITDEGYENLTEYPKELVIE